MSNVVLHNSLLTFRQLRNFHLSKECWEERREKITHTSETKNE